MSYTVELGRLGNQIIRNLAVSLIAKKYDLYVNYCNYNIINNQLGIPLYIGNNKFNETIDLTDNNYFELYNKETLLNNINPNNDYFQTKEITNVLYNYLNEMNVKHNIISKNPFIERYNNNNDFLIHIRLTDAEQFNPGIDYYKKVINNINFDTMYITTDDNNHWFIQELFKQYHYKNPTILLSDKLEEIIQFSSTCRHVLLSHGSFSSVIGYLSFFSNIYYPEYDDTKKWHGDMFSIDGWNKIKHL
jgi:hypothetical protein